MIREYIAVIDDNDGGTSGITNVEIVRCKDCKYQLKRGGMSGCKILAGWTKTDNRFCSYGERKGE